MFNKILIVLFLPALVFSQKPGKSKFEKSWALAHPIAAIKVKRIYRQTLPFYNDHLIHKQLDSFSNGGKLDAFRHVFFMAAFTQKVKVKKIRALGFAHEKGNRYNAFKGKKALIKLTYSLYKQSVVMSKLL